MAGRPPRTEQVKGVHIRIPPALVKRVEHCQWLLQRQLGPRVNLNDAFWKTIEAGCAALEQTLEGKEIAEIAQIPLSKLSTISGEDISVPGYGFPEDPEDEAEIPAPASHTNGTQALALAEVLAEAAAFLEDEDDEAPAEPVLEQTPSTKTPALSEDIVKIADARAEYDKLSEREFAQLLYDRKIYRHQAKDGSEVRIPHTTLRQWLKQAREAGVL
jgi:hypothetical protein